MLRSLASVCRFNAARSFAPMGMRPAMRLFSEEASEKASSGKSRETGVVKWFDSSKGFGFIVRSSGQDIFVHFTGIGGSGYRSLEEGQRVEFSVGSGPKGPVALEVTLQQ